MYLFTYIGTYIYTCIHTAHMHIDTYTFSRHMVSVGSQTSAQVMLTEVPKDVPVEDACTWGSKKWLWGVIATWRIIPLNNWLVTGVSSPTCKQDNLLRRLTNQDY